MLPKGLFEYGFEGKKLALDPEKIAWLFSPIQVTDHPTQETNNYQSVFDWFGSELTLVGGSKKFMLPETETEHPRVLTIRTNELWVVPWSLMEALESFGLRRSDRHIAHDRWPCIINEHAKREKGGAKKMDRYEQIEYEVTAVDTALPLLCLPRILQKVHHPERTMWELDDIYLYYDWDASQNPAKNHRCQIAGGESSFHWYKL